MSSLYKLSISGVRSFSPKDHETIQFGAPLTLICGQNGCGKTTIIECLKYATTGDLPPNSKGGAFVNDPTVADRLVVNAEIKLGFISVDGKLMTVTRNMQLNRKRASKTQSQAANTFKTLEGQLAVISGGHKNSISTKNAELDMRMPLYLGASKAVLEYVIFCHQDDSLWPLSEAGVLKKRFDEIFEASKFSKVLDNLKSIRKDMATDIKLIEQSVQHAKIDKVRAKKIREKLEDSKGKVEHYTEDIAQLTIEIERYEKKADDLFNSNQEFQKTLSEHERLVVMIENRRANSRRLGDSIEILHETDEELAHTLANFAEIQKQKKSQISKLDSENLVLDNEASELQSTYHELVRKEGILSAKKQGYEQDLKSMEELKVALLETYGFDFSSIDANAGEELENIVALEQRDHDRIAAQNKERVSEASRKLQLALDAVFRESEHLSYCEREINAATEKLKTHKKKIASLSESEELLEVEKSQLDTFRAKLEKKKGQSTVDSLMKQVSEENTRISQLEQDLDELMKEIHSASKQSDLRSKMDLIQESREVKSNVLKKQVASLRVPFEKLMESELEPKDCESIFEKKLQSASETQLSSVKEHDDLKDKMNHLDSKLHAARAKVADFETKSKQHLGSILNVLEEHEISDYESLLKELEENYKVAVYNLNTFEVTKSYKMKAVDVAKQTKCCTLCNRGMNNDELSKFIKEILENVAAVTANKLTDDVEATFKEMEEIKNINVDIFQYRSMTEELVKLKSDLKEQDSAATDLQKQIDLAQNSVSLSTELVESLNDLLKPIAIIARIVDEIRTLETQSSELEEDLAGYGAPPRPMAELQKLQQQKNFEIRNLRQSVTDANDEQKFQQNELSKLEAQVKDKELQISKLQLSLNEALSLKNTISDLENQLSGLKDKKVEITGHLEDLSREKNEAESEVDKVKKECEQNVAASHRKLQAAKDESSRFVILQEGIKQFEDEDSRLVSEVTSKLKESKEKIDEISQEKRQNEQERKVLQEAINAAVSTERNVKDNLEYRDTIAELDRLQESISALDIDNAEKQKDHFHQESRKLREKISELNSEHYGKVGEVKQINDQILQLQNDLQTEFKGVDKYYHTEWVKLQANLLMSNDLQTYSQALDNAIIKYHSLKMDEINRILRELWNQTYKGTDIDGIEIKCDVTKQVRGRSYNYRVVMYKKSSELDMRGRCSAGQKVLTSILVRLALAECFGTNCGMIALDEPTTNLDVENAESLANALNNIIGFRKNQKNFQLIVITHDERFLSHINGDRYTDNFYRIERDENQHSVIKSLPIHLMQDD